MLKPLGIPILLPLNPSILKNCPYPPLGMYLDAAPVASASSASYPTMASNTWTASDTVRHIGLYFVRLKMGDGDDAGAAGEPNRRLNPDHRIQRRWAQYRPVGLRPQRHRRHVRRRRHRRTAARSARGERAHVRILCLAAAGAPAVRGGAVSGPLGEAGLTEDNGAGGAEASRHAGVAGDDGAEQRERPGRRVEPVACRDVVLEQDGDAVERPAAATGGALVVGARRLGERVGVDLDDGVEERVEAGDLVEVEADERRGGEAAVAEAELDGVDGGLVELEAGGGGDGGESHDGE
ncbi:Os04g0184250 [Oryza sativa Japonica Group]|uniref:Os04g0184250 protein n=1 Tax=Oryza sativa subsp. japonica TaxID=39947 RepID=A0A0P0W755_ORYSJ|nr:hypothetical protein EE612_022341 [Oryza sativa]BAS87988.1 Os04g0184250 [Oryza sativa Japonica Group]